MKTIYSAITRADELVGTYYEIGYENYALTILQELHINTKRLPTKGCWWTDAKMTKKGLLVFTDYSRWECDYLLEALKQKFVNLTITYTFVDYH